MRRRQTAVSRHFQIAERDRFSGCQLPTRLRKKKKKNRIGTLTTKSLAMQPFISKLFIVGASPTGRRESEPSSVLDFSSVNTVLRPSGHHQNHVRPSISVEGSSGLTGGKMLDPHARRGVLKPHRTTTELRSELNSCLKCPALHSAINCSRKIAVELE